ncbi:hypothetical protein PQX77_021784 [Marasmius sp. AFHP31]|nr:hypothetical protein PQX77_021784 [Marasmius sp. AFHP31]
MTKDQTKELLRLLSKAHAGAKVQLQTHEQVQNMWEAAIDRTTRFESTEISVPYRKETRIYMAYYRPIATWIREVLQDANLSSFMEWDARRLHRFDGERWERFIDEPWTANTWWEAQTRINERPARVQGDEPQQRPNAKPLALILYADKDKLSSFGTAKGYPVIATIGNLPADIRNAGGIGGGKVVGWQPVVEEEAEHTKKKAFVDFKFTVWHEAFLKILESIIVMSQVGESIKCGDGVTRLIYVILLALSADYEEQCMVGKENLSDLSHSWRKRNAEDTTEVLNDVSEMNLKGEQEELLKMHSLRYGQNVSMRLTNFDPFQAVSFDDLYFEDSGMWGAHLFPRLKDHFEHGLGRAAKAALDKSAVTTMTFNDGSKHRDVSRMFLFAAEGLFQKEQDPAAYQLLKCVRAYVNIMMYAGLHVQTTATMAAGRESIRMFHGALIKYMELPIPEKMKPKNWDFIKLHYFAHLFDDIQNKGALRNFSTRLFEKKHGPLRVIYQRRTNFKNIATQILNIKHQLDVSDIIKADIETMEAYKTYLKTQEDPPEDTEVLEGLGGRHFTIGSKLQAATFEDFCRTHGSSDVRMRNDLASYMSIGLQAAGKPLPNNRWLQFKPSDCIVPFQYLKVNYESYETWKLTTDYLRCNPSFHNRPRYDFVLFSAGSVSEPTFAQLKHLFICEVGGEKYALAYVQPYKVITVGRRPQSDRDFGILRIQREQANEFVWLHSIVRGALVVASADEEDECLVVDTIDYDMFLRVKKHWPQYTVNASQT